MENNMISELTQIVEMIDQLLPQLKNFIVQFNQVVATSGVNVVTDTGGNMSLDVPSSMPDETAEQIGKKLEIIDRLINTRGQEINTFIEKGLNLEKKLESPEFKSKILEKVAEYEKLNKSYNHYVRLS
jgi:hypothetical protein